MQGEPAGSEEQRAAEHWSEPEALLALPGDEHADERDRHAPDETDRGTGVLERRGRVTPRLNRRLRRERAADDAEEREVGMLCCDNSKPVGAAGPTRAFRGGGGVGDRGQRAQSPTPDSAATAARAAGVSR